MVQNLTTFSCQKNSDKADENLTTFSCQVLPTRETQVRPLAKLEPEEQLEVWEQAVERAGGKVPTERIVKAEVLRHKGIVEQMKEKNPSPPEFTKGEVCEIRVGKSSLLRQFDGMWGIVEHVGSFSYTVRISIAKDVQQCKGEEMAKVDEEYTADITTVAERIRFVVQNFELEPIEYDILGNLQRSKWFTPKQLRHLEIIERDYGILQDRVGA